MNFEQFSSSFFKVGFDYHRRLYQVFDKRNGFLKLTNVMTGETLFDNLNPAEILINNIAMEDINQLQNLVFNRSCICDAENIIPEPFKYFDLSFDETFE